MERKYLHLQIVQNFYQLSRVFIVSFLLKNLFNNFSFFTVLALIGSLAIFVYFCQHKEIVSNNNNNLFFSPTMIFIQNYTQIQHLVFHP